MGFQIEKINLRQISMPLVHFFETSFGRTYERHIVLVEVVAGGVSGWGEVTAGEGPFYNEEWTESAWIIVRDYAAPRVLKTRFEGPEEIAPRTAHIRGHRMAQGGLEAAVWDLAARLNNRPLWQEIGGGARKEIPCGVSIGIQETVADLLRKIETELAAGYQRIKMKIKPGRDVEDIRAVRKEFPQIKLMADANSAYTLADADHLRRLDEFYLMMVEQPLAHDDIIDHAALQAKLQTPVCLDECIRSARHAGQAIRLGACRIINIKPGRVGGHAESIRLHDLCASRGVPVWHGGMLESGIGRAHNLHLSSLPNFTLPGDVAASRRYYVPDLIDPPIEVGADGLIPVPTGPGIGVTVMWDRVERATERRLSLPHS